MPLSRARTFSRRIPGWLLLRYLVVDNVQVHPLGAAEQAEAYVQHQRDSVEDRHVDQGLAIVDTVGGVEEPLVEGYRGGVVDVGFAPRQNRRRDGRTEERSGDDQRGI